MSTRCTHILQSGIQCKLNAKDDQKCCKRHTHHTCPVCFEIVGTADKKTLMCKHTFHMNCILTWFVEGDTCPVCRVSQQDTELIIFREQIQESMRQKYKDAIDSLESDLRQLRGPRRALPPRRATHEDTRILEEMALRAVQGNTRTRRLGEAARRALDGED